MKSKGFTLIELLAVIVILAIIALIAVPIVINIVNNAREESYKRSIELYGKAVENAIAKDQIDGKEFKDGQYILDSSTGEICRYENNVKTSDCITPEVEGTIPDSYTMEIQGGKIIEQTITLKTNGPSYTKRGNGSWTKEGSSNEEQNNNEEELPNITVTKATAQTVTTGNVPQGNYAAGDEYIIHIGGEDRIFFILGENSEDSTKVDLIMNQNIGSTVAWCGDENLCKTNNEWDKTKGPITANAYLGSQTSDWEVAPYLPTNDQIECAYTGDMPIWLYDNFNSADLYGYWTASPIDYISDYGGRSYFVISFGYVFDDGWFNANNLDSAEHCGVRPVITISKSMLN